MEKTVPPPGRSVLPMMKIANAQLWVHDQDEALAFYTDKVGMEVRSDATLPEIPGFRWLTIAPRGQEDVAITLMAIPGPDMALIMRNAVVHGRRTGLATMLGGLAGLSVHATASVVGLSALLATSATAFAVVKLVGAVYLTLLGLRALRHAAGRTRRRGAGGAGANGALASPPGDAPGLAQ